MTTIENLIKLLNKYPQNMVVTNEQNENFIHIINSNDSVILSTQKPIGICARSGGYVYPSVVSGYDGYSVELDEDLYNCEILPLF